MGYMTDNHKGGRPPIFDKLVIARELVEWAKKDDSINLNAFCCWHEPPIAPNYLSQWSKEQTLEGELISQAMYIAKSFLACRREAWVGSDKLNQKAFDRNATVYDLFLKQEERDQLEFESSLKSKELNTTSQADLDRFESVMGQLLALRVRNIEESSNNREPKS